MKSTSVNWRYCVFILEQIEYVMTRLSVLLFVMSPTMGGCSKPPAASSVITPSSPQQLASSSALDDFFALFGNQPTTAHTALARIEANWHSGSTAILVESLRFARNSEIRRAMIRLVERMTKQSFGDDYDRWHQWIWRSQPKPHPDHAEFKAKLYANMDPRFAEYFGNERPSVIRMDEIIWGGVERDGIPPLIRPKMVAADRATYLRDSHLVFGVVINGDARAYPKRILAWHEMFKDTIGGVSVNGVYCTLCGSMIVYETNVDGIHHELGTSGFLFRSNKLMYDKATKSLWATLEGKPVVGPLAGKGIQLARRHVVTTTWRQWRSRHPNSQVLSLNTGYDRDYSEGAAYRDYFATDELMFPVPTLDPRLAKKHEVLGLRTDSNPAKALAVSIDFLQDRSVYHDQLADNPFVILTDKSSAARVYLTQSQRFQSWDGEHTAIDSEGRHWNVTESAITGADGTRLARLPAHRSFWFGWHAAFPHSRLVSAETK